MAAVVLEDVWKSYESGGGTTDVLTGVDLTVADGESVLVFGPSGSGKSTLLNLAAGLDAPDAGRVRVGDRELTSLGDRELTRFRRETLGIIFQAFNLIPSLSALENVELGIEPVVDDPRDAAQTSLRRVGLGDKLGRYPSQLSGGEQQRVAIARALAKNPSVVVADEPTGNLDRETSTQVVDLIRRLNEEEGTTFVIVSHDPVLDPAADRKLWLEGGSLRPSESHPDATP